MIKKSALIFAIILVILSAGLFYINKVLLPVQAKAMLIKAAEDALGRKVTLDSLQYGPIRGFTVTNLTVYSKDTPDEVFLHVDQASAQILFFALIQKKIILPSVRVDNLSARVIRLDKNTWNFSDLLAPKPAAASSAAAGTPASAPAMDLIISGLAVNNARIKVTDLARGDDFTEMIEPVTISGGLSLSGGYNMTGSIGIPATQGLITINARGSLNRQNHKAALTIVNIDTSRYLRFIPEGIPVPLQAATVTSLKTDIFWQDTALTVSGDMLIKGIDATPAKDTRVQGDAGINKMFFSYKKDTLTFQGGLTINGASLTLPEGRSASANIHTTQTRFDMTGTDWSASSDAAIKSLILVAGKDQRVQTDLTITQAAVEQKGGIITATGDVAAQDLTAAISRDQKISGNISLKKASATINKADIRAAADIAADGVKISLPGTTAAATFSAPQTAFSLSKGAMDIKVAPSFQSLSATFGQGMSFSGAPKLTLHAAIPASGEGPLSYDGNAEISGGLLKGLPTVSEVGRIHALLTIATDTLTVSDMSFTALGIPVTARGSVRNFADPSVNITAEAPGVDLTVLRKIIPQIMEDNGLAVTGKADITVTAEGKAAALAQSGLRATAVLSNIAAESTKLKQAVKNISGTVTYNAPVLLWKDLSIGYQDKTYVLNGSLEDLAAPLIATSVRSDNLSVEAQVKKAGDTLKILSLKGTLFDSSVNVTGTILIPPGKAPVIDLTTDSKVTLRDIPKVLPDQAKLFDQYKLAGILKIKAHVQGNPADWQHLTSSFTVETPALSVMGYQVDNINLSAEQKDGGLQPFDLKCNVYDGDLGVVGKIDLIGQGFPFDINFRLTGTSLERLKKDTPIRDQQLSGTVSASGEMKGKALDIKSFDGKILTAIKDGYLWDLKILSNVLSILSSTSSGGGVTITEASATLNVKDGKVETNDLLLKGATVSVLGEGTLDMLDQSLDFNVTPRVEAPASTNGQTNLLDVINPTAGLVNIHIGGTLQKPEIKHNVTAPTLIKKSLQNTVGNLLKLFE